MPVNQTVEIEIAGKPGRFSLKALKGGLPIGPVFVIATQAINIQTDLGLKPGLPRS
jgi:hypothetical protein